MLYQSTRGRDKKISFEEAIIKGIADDGGLFVPEMIPKVSTEFIASLADLDYASAAAEIVGLFTDNFSKQEICNCTARAYNERSFCNPDITPLRSLDERIGVMELYHGPTAAFKDVALQLLPPMLTLALKKTGVKESLAILVATSGDTGKAALEGFRDVPGTSILVYYPKDGVSEAQKLQMITQEGENTAVAAVDGNFDDAQNGVKAIFGDADAKRVLHEKGILLSSANSINWGRLLPQIVYYFRAYTTLLKDGKIASGAPICFVVPTGNFGNILAGWYAREMGLPVSRFICASNSNNVLADFIRTGIYDKNREFMLTMSPAMDILISSNLERLLYELSGRDSEMVVGWMEELARCGSYNVGKAVHEKLAALFFGGYASEAETERAICDTFQRYNYILDTHTAVGMHVLREYDSSAISDEKVVLVATASPFKFAKDVYRAIMDDGAGGACDSAGDGAYSEGDGAYSEGDDELQYIDLLSEYSGEPIPESLRDLRNKPVLHLTETTQSNMKETAINILTTMASKDSTEM